MDSLSYESKIIIDKIPFQWGQKFELYYPDLPGFPTVYVHFKDGVDRVYGFPISVNFIQKSNETGTAEIRFISNMDLNSNKKLKDKTKIELENRFGVSDKIAWTDIKNSCKGNLQYENFFKDLWDIVEHMHGKFIPFGRFYEEIYSIVRFVAAWAPKTGRQSEMRMLYNFVSIFGEKVVIDSKWNHLDFFILPTYDDIRAGTLSDFPKFQELYTAMKKIWKEFFTVKTTFPHTSSCSCGQHLSTISSMPKGESFPPNKQSFMTTITGPLLSSGKITMDDKTNIDRLVDMFNRNSTRASFFIWSIMSISDTDFKAWSKKDFVDFYLNLSDGIGISPKITACFLQQGFDKNEFIPIDTWVEAFHENALGLEREDFFNSFSLLGKLERVIWIASQANKTNIQSFFDTLWCTRYGTNGNEVLRGANPIACYECKLNTSCPGYAKIKNANVLVEAESNSTYAIIKIRKKDVATVSDQIATLAQSKKCLFICVTENSIPKKIYKQKGKGNGRYWKLTDEFSGYLLDSQKTKLVGKVCSVKNLVNSLPNASNFNFMDIA